MTDEQLKLLKIGKRIKADLDNIDCEIEQWQKSQVLKSISIAEDNNNGIYDVDIDTIDFNSLKKNALATLQSRKQLLENEFKNL